MGSIVLIVVAAAWVAVLAPPLLRGRQDNRASSSVVDFRRQLSTLQRSAPMRGTAPMRSMARPLAPSPTRSYGAPRVGSDSTGIARRGAAHRSHARSDASRGARRPVGIRQRRQNVLMAMVMSTFGSAFIAFTTKSDFFVYLFVFSAMGLAGYCYKLSQVRRYQSGSSTQGYRRDWIRAS